MTLMKDQTVKKVFLVLIPFISSISGLLVYNEVVLFAMPSTFWSWIWYGTSMISILLGVVYRPIIPKYSLFSIVVGGLMFILGMVTPWVLGTETERSCIDYDCSYYFTSVSYFQESDEFLGDGQLEGGERCIGAATSDTQF